jgi:adenosine deaminase
MKSYINLTLLTAQSLLDHFKKGSAFDVQVLSRLVFVESRARNPHWPDYVYRNYLDEEFGSFSRHAKCLLIAFDTLNKHYLHFRGNEIFVKEEVFGEWQQALTEITPLPLIAYSIYKQIGFSTLDHQVWQQIKSRTERLLCGSALPTSYFPHLEEMIEKEGLFELHMHLNGTTEIDTIWQDALNQPHRFYVNLKRGIRNPAVQEQYLQIGYQPEQMFSDLLLAKKLRFVMIRAIFPRSFPDDYNSFISWQQPLTMANARRMISRQFQGDEPAPYSHNGERHPIEIVRPDLGRLSETAREAAFLIVAFNYLELSQDDAFALCLHTYLLVLNRFNKIVVQQCDQKGFDQFQKITLNEQRRLSEESYYKRFKQLEGMYREYLQYLEGRFVPWNTYNLLKKILCDFERYDWESRNESIRERMKDREAFREQERALVTSSYSGRVDAIPSQYLRREMQFKLVAHFIKTRDSAATSLEGEKSLWCRHLVLRKENAMSARTLMTLCSKDRRLEKYVNGADAAANEMHTPPEVYAPVFRMLRRKGWRNFTFHVGEDFVHVVSGIRAIYEALVFLDLRDKNRIGHATAIGISPDLWLSRMRTKINIDKGEWLDNLAFAYNLISKDGVHVGQHARIREEMNWLFQEIYLKTMPDIHTYIDSWRMRCLDPLKAFDFERRLESLDNAELVEWNECERARRGKQQFGFDEATFDENKLWSKRKIKLNGDGEALAFNLFRRYHSLDVMKRYTEKIEVDADFFPREVLVYLQKKVLAEVKRRCVAIETMPTSNVRISFYNDCREHHLFRWLGLSCDKNHTPADEELDRDTRPDICIASDDPGIFATNLRNEYAHVYNTLITDYGKCHVEAIDILKRINENCRVYRFEEKPTL